MCEVSTFVLTDVGWHMACRCRRFMIAPPRGSYTVWGRWGPAHHSPRYTGRGGVMVRGVGRTTLTVMRVSVMIILYKQINVSACSHDKTDNIQIITGSVLECWEQKTQRDSSNIIQKPFLPAFNIVYTVFGLVETYLNMDQSSSWSLDGQIKNQNTFESHKLRRAGTKFSYELF